MKTLSTRISALLLVVITLFSLFPSAMAAEAPTEPTVVATATEPQVPSEPDSTLPLENPTISDEEFSEIPTNQPMGQPSVLAERRFTNMGFYQIPARGRVYLDPYNTGRYLSSINRMYFSDPTEFAFCIQPGTPTGSSYIQDNSVNPWTRLSENQRRAMGVVLALGFPKSYRHEGFPSSPGQAEVMGDSLAQWQRSEHYAATQIILWEILRGERSSTPPYIRSSSYTLDQFYGFQSPDWNSLKAEYDALDRLLSSYGIVPSFASASVSSAPSHEMVFDESRGLYTLTLTDTDHVLTLLTPAPANAQEMHSFDFSANGISISRSGSTLTLTAPESMGEQLNQGVLVQSSGSAADPSSNCIVWSSGSKQVLVTSAGGSADFPPAYFRLTGKPIIKTGSLRIQKATNTGTALDGWKIAVSTDPAGNYPIPASPFTTSSDGVVIINDLEPGTYYVQEVDESELCPYWKFDSSCQEIVVVANQTSSATVTNIRLGRIMVQKNAINGSPEGWRFEVLKDGVVIETITTGSDGCGYSAYLEPGNYVVREIHDRDDAYWEYDVNVEQDVTVKPWEDAAVVYTNEQFGRLQIEKEMADGSSVEGWVFRVTDSAGTEIAGSPFTTDSSGLIVSGKLEPGAYTVEELIPEDSIYHCTEENPKTITVVSGETASVHFTNALRSGKISLEKADPSGKPLVGAAFLLEWSEDGILWAPVGSSDAIIKGGCSTPGLSHGCLTTGEDGKITFDGLYPALQYRLTEVIAPNGYNLLTDYAYVGSLPATDLTIQLRVVNTPILVLPHTGSSAVEVLPIFLFLAMFVDAAVLNYLRKKKKK